MKIKFVILVFLALVSVNHYSWAQQNKKVKNIIMLIPDGASMDLLALSRWYKFGICPQDECWLNVDPYITGLVKTHSSDAPIGDSAPTGSTYATGYLSRTGFVATYPTSSGKDKDLFKVDQSRAYQPLYTILEAAKLNQKSTGLVVTCHFPHATPADFAAHTPKRDKYFDISKQMVYNRLNVVFGGGTNYLSPKFRDDKEDLVSVLKQRNYKYITTRNELNGIKSSDSLVWGLFAPEALPNDLDRDKDTSPSLAEMTSKAIEVLSGNPKGFFLMVEGSKVDWSAHGNDPIGMITEFLAFDEAVKAALEFAKKDGNTAVIVCTDHGNSGISIGGPRTRSGYDTLGVLSLIEPLRNCKLTADGLAAKISPLTTDQEIVSVFKEYTSITLSTEEIETIKTGKKNLSLSRTIAKIITDKTYLGFTTTGHTGEDVFLAVYHPDGYNLSGVVQNTKVNGYMREISGNVNLDSLSTIYYSRDSVALQGLSWNIIPKTDSANVVNYGKLVVRKTPKSKMRAEIKAYTDYITIYNNTKVVKTIPLNSVVVYNYLEDKADKKKLTMQRFYCPKNLGEILHVELK
jgi:alkaline phosphatase